MVRYTGILPDLFREELGILVQGQINQNGVFEATEVLAKHDENYMPPELMELQGQQPVKQAPSAELSGVAQDQTRLPARQAMILSWGMPMLASV